MRPDAREVVIVDGDHQTRARRHEIEQVLGVVLVAVDDARVAEQRRGCRVVHDHVEGSGVALGIAPVERRVDEPDAVTTVAEPPSQVEDVPLDAALKTKSRGHEDDHARLSCGGRYARRMSVRPRPVEASAPRPVDTSP